MYTIKLWLGGFIECQVFCLNWKSVKNWVLVVFFFISVGFVECRMSGWVLSLFGIILTRLWIGLKSRMERIFMTKRSVFENEFEKG